MNKMQRSLVIGVIKTLEDPEVQNEEMDRQGILNVLRLVLNEDDRERYRK